MAMRGMQILHCECLHGVCEAWHYFESSMLGGLGGADGGLFGWAGGVYMCADVCSSVNCAVFLSISLASMMDAAWGARGLGCRHGEGCNA